MTGASGSRGLFVYGGGGEIMRDDFLPLLNLGKWLLWSQFILRRLSSAVGLLGGNCLFSSAKCGYLGGLAAEGKC